MFSQRSRRVSNVYKSIHPEAAIRDVRFVLKDDALLALIRVRTDQTFAPGLVEEAGLTPISDVTHEGSRLIVAHIKHTPEDTIKALGCKADTLALVPPEVKKGFNPWVWRGITSFVGQSLQLASSFTTVGSKADKNAVFTFASLNLLANVSNIVFGSQKKEDPHQLRLLESSVNDQARAAGATGELPATEDKRTNLHQDVDPKRSLGEKAYDTLQKISVTGGEIGLRTVGSAALAFPMNRWKTGFQTLKHTGSIGETFHAMKNPTASTFRVGLVMLTGKFVSLLSKEPDPYNPAPQSTFDRIREKVTFRASSLIEGGAAAYMMHDRYANQKIQVFGKQYRDHFGGLGNAVFIGGYGIRLTAPYGSRQVKMRELYAHSADALAQVPREKIPDALARTALMLDTHFGEKSAGIDTLYTEIATRLKSYHGIDVTKPNTSEVEPAEAPTADRAPSTQVSAIADHAALHDQPALAQAAR